MAESIIKKEPLTVVDCGDVNLSGAWDAVQIYHQVVPIKYFDAGIKYGFVYKYEGSQYGTAIGIGFGAIELVTVLNGNKTTRVI